MIKKIGGGAAPAGGAAAPAGKVEAPKEEKKPEKKEEPKEEEVDIDLGGGLFGDDFWEPQHHAPINTFSFNSIYK